MTSDDAFAAPPLNITPDKHFRYIGTSIKKIKFDCPFLNLLYLNLIFAVGKKKTKKNYVYFKDFICRRTIPGLIFTQ